VPAAAITQPLSAFQVLYLISAAKNTELRVEGGWSVGLAAIQVDAAALISVCAHTH
jgi:hypothetical protein